MLSPRVLAMISATSKPSQPLIAIAGATGTGKSKLAVELARCFNGEIINADALQLYEGLDIATNKHPIPERHNVPHHLISCIQLTERPWTVHQFHAKASEAIGAIRARGKLPILVGGTTYYLQSLLAGGTLLKTTKPVDSIELPVANQWSVLNQPTETIYAELMKRDPEMAAKWHPNDRRKISRSLEICLETEAKTSQLYQAQRQAKPNSDEDMNLPDSAMRQTPSKRSISSQVGIALDAIEDALILWTHASRETLQIRLSERVDKMMQDGLLDEVRHLYQRSIELEQAGTPLDSSHGITTAIGYKELIPALGEAQAKVQPAEASAQLAECVDRIKIHTRQYVKRQVRWIHLQLLPALDACQRRHSLFLLDTSQLSLWQTEVEQKARDIVHAYLHGLPLPSPATQSALAEEMLRPREKADRIARHCALCDKTMMNETEWARHVKSKWHRKAQANENKLIAVS